jgi:hypothetical protein
MKNKVNYLWALTFALVITAVAIEFAHANASDVDNSELYTASSKNTMRQIDAESVLAVIHAETFDSAFSHYSTYRDIQDMKFHELRKAYINARKELFDYVSEAAHNTSEKPYYMATYENAR